MKSQRCVALLYSILEGEDMITIEYPAQPPELLEAVGDVLLTARVIHKSSTVNIGRGRSQASEETNHMQCQCRGLHRLALTTKTALLSLGSAAFPMG